MKQLLNTPVTRSVIRLAALLTLFGAGYAHAGEDAATTSGGRAMAMQMEAEVTAIDRDTRQVSLQGPMGETVTVTAREQLVKLEDVQVGDVLVISYLAALEGELREPTEEELAEPWAVLEGAEATAPGSEHPMAGAARIIRAVCTIEGLNRILGSVTVMDSRGKLHVIADVEPEKMAGVTLGQEMVLVFSEALALSLEHKSAAE